MRFPACPLQTHSASFNPRPAVRPGDAPPARPKPSTTTCFNPRPAVRPGDASNKHRHRHHHHSFNPRPAVRPGDAPWVAASAERTDSFNPRPAVRPGDASHCCQLRSDTQFQSAPGREAGRCSTLLTDCFDCEAAPACASLLASASAAEIFHASFLVELLKNKGLRPARNPGQIVFAWGSRVI